MIRFAYLGALLFSLAGLTFADWRYKLALFADHNRAVRVLVGCVCFFVAWDVLGIILHIFFTGTSTYISGWFFAPEFPVEELFFLILLSYTTLLTWRGLQKL